MLATLFAHYGGYGAFVDGFTAALWAAVGFSGLGVGAALLTAARHVALAPEIAVAGEPA